MPITQLMQKLSGKLDSRSGRRSSNGNAALEANRTAEPMECCTSFEVVAEVVPLSPGSQAGSMCSASTASDDSNQGASTSQQHQLTSTSDGKPFLSSSSSAALLASSFSGPLPALAAASAGSKPATERALRARGKAMLRTESGLPTLNTSCSPNDIDLQHQLSMESSSSMMDATLSSSLPYSLVGRVASPRYIRSCTAPLPGSLRSAAPGSLSAVQEPPAAVSTKALIKTTVPAAVVHEAEREHDDHDDDLVHPTSPAAGEGEDDDHCHWEDGVVASWLQGIDHSELLHDGDDHEEQHVAAGKQGAMGAAQDTCAKGPTSVFSSLLYN